MKTVTYKTTKQISIIIPTYNRSMYLHKAVESFLNQTFDASCYEIIIVNNNSTDDTAQVVQACMKNSKGSISYIFEPRQGLHYATNTGVQRALGDIIIFGDDDVIVEGNYLEKIYYSFKNDDSIGIIGGKILPLWNDTPPVWIYDYGNDKVHSVFAYLDYGNNCKVLEKEYVFGCNFAIRKSIFFAIGGRAPDTFPKHLKYLSGGGETLMIDNVRKLGLKVVYQPEAVVYHHASTQRATIEYFIDRHERFAIEQVFSNFRTLSRFAATRLALCTAFKKLKEVSWYKVSCLLKRKKNVFMQKYNPSYFALVQIRYAAMLVKQTLKVLTNKELLKNIRRGSYIDSGYVDLEKELMGEENNA